MKHLCFCTSKTLDLEEATYVINYVPCCDVTCYEACLEAQGVGPHHVVPVTYRRSMRVAGGVS